VPPEGFEAIDKFVIFKTLQITSLRGSCATTNSGKITNTVNTAATKEMTAFRCI
jgi:hypothetical protein